MEVWMTESPLAKFRNAQNCTVLATKYPFFNTKHPVIILRGSLFVVTPAHVASWKNGCQNFSYFLMIIVAENTRSVNICWWSIRIWMKQNVCVLHRFLEDLSGIKRFKWRPMFCVAYWKTRFIHKSCSKSKNTEHIAIDFLSLHYDAKMKLLR